MVVVKSCLGVDERLSRSVSKLIVRRAETARVVLSKKAQATEKRRWRSKIIIEHERGCLQY